MIRLTSRPSQLSRALTLATLVAFVFTLTTPGIAASQTVGDAGTRVIYGKFDEVIKLKVDGQYDQAIDKLQEIIKQYSNSEEVLRRAYNHLVAIYHERGDQNSVQQTARQALLKFPDLTADRVSFPEEINQYYDTLREEMFGSLAVKNPKGCRVFLGDNHVGDTPLDLKLVRAGEYDLTLTKSGHHDYKDRIIIRPGALLSENVSLRRQRGKWWWITRGAGVAVVTTAALIIGLSGDDEGAAPPAEPLPGPPGPPGN